MSRADGEEVVFLDTSGLDGLIGRPGIVPRLAHPACSGQGWQDGRASIALSLVPI